MVSEYKEDQFLTGHHWRQLKAAASGSYGYTDMMVSCKLYDQSVMQISFED